MEMIVMTNVFIWIMRFTAIPFLIYHGFFFKKITLSCDDCKESPCFSQNLCKFLHCTQKGAPQTGAPSSIFGYAML